MVSELRGGQLLDAHVHCELRALDVGLREAGRRREPPDTSQFHLLLGEVDARPLEHRRGSPGRGFRRPDALAELLTRPGVEQRGRRGNDGQ